MAKRILSDYGAVILGFVVLVAGMLIDFIGIHGASSIGFWAFVLLCILQAIRPQRELNQYKNSNPNIIVKRVYPKKNTPTTDFVLRNPNKPEERIRHSGGTIGFGEVYMPAFRDLHGSTEDIIETLRTEQTYVLVDFVNNPERRVEINDAVDVIARISYFDDAGNNILNREIKGLWEGIEPTTVPNPIESEFTKITIPSNGDERSICIAIKSKFDQECFAYAFESYGHTHFLRNQSLNLNIGTIRVEIVLSGRNMNDTKPFIFRLVNPGIGRDISATLIQEEQ